MIYRIKDIYYKDDNVRNDNLCWKGDIRYFFSWIQNHDGNIWDVYVIEE